MDKHRLVEPLQRGEDDRRLADADVAREQAVALGADQGAEQVGVARRVDRRHEDAVERLVGRRPPARVELLLPVDPLAVPGSTQYSYRVLVRELRVELAHARVDPLARLLGDGAADGPDAAEEEPHLDEPVVGVAFGARLVDAVGLGREVVKHRAEVAHDAHLGEGDGLLAARAPNVQQLGQRLVDEGAQALAHVGVGGLTQPRLDVGLPAHLGRVDVDHARARVVAGDATERSSTSKSSETCGGIAMRSPLMSVSSLLSSSTVFIDSIQSVSTGPSSSSHFSSGRSSAQTSRITLARTPSVHSKVCRSYSP